MTKYKVEYTCPNCCGEDQYDDGDIEEILAEIFASGWPICPECGFDMDFNVKE